MKWGRPRYRPTTLSVTVAPAPDPTRAGATAAERYRLRAALALASREIAALEARLSGDGGGSLRQAATDRFRDLLRRIDAGEED